MIKLALRFLARNLHPSFLSIDKQGLRGRMICLGKGAVVERRSSVPLRL
jgi:hypothetical protein